MIEPKEGEDHLDLLHFFDFSPLCVFKGVLICYDRQPKEGEDHLDLVYLLELSPLCVFKCVFSNMCFQMFGDLL